MRCWEVVLHTFSVVAEGHLGLTKTNCVLSGAGAIVLLELSLVDILHGGAPRCQPTDSIQFRVQCDFRRMREGHENSHAFIRRRDPLVCDSMRDNQ